jgi:hypothetical protein
MPEIAEPAIGKFSFRVNLWARPAQTRLSGVCVGFYRAMRNPGAVGPADDTEYEKAAAGSASVTASVTSRDRPDEFPDASQAPVASLR